MFQNQFLFLLRKTESEGKVRYKECFGTWEISIHKIAWYNESDENHPKITLMISLENRAITKECYQCKILTQIVDQ